MILNFIIKQIIFRTKYHFFAISFYYYVFFCFLYFIVFTKNQYFFPVNMKTIPVEDIDRKTEVIVIKSPKHTLNIGPIFRDFKKLQIIRINNANVPNMGTASFWGIVSLKILGEW